MAYNKHTWETGEIVSATKLNNMENGIANNDSAIGTIPETVEQIQTELEQKANIDGAYESMTVGNAEQLVSTQYVEDTAPYVYRTSGGSADIGNREEDTIVGGTVAWNQLVRNGNFASGSKDPFGGASWSVGDGEVYTNTGGSCPFYQTLPITLGHVLLYTFSIKQDTVVTNDLRLGINVDSISSNTITSNVFNGNTSLNWIRKSYIKKPSTEITTTNLGLRFAWAGASPLGSTEVVHLKDIMVFDLTQMFGTEVADAVYAMEQANEGSGVAWFKSQYPLDYYEYDEGTLKSVEGLQSHDTVGFNQWDEKWELGTLDETTGEPISTGATIIRSKNFIKVLPNTTYYNTVKNVLNIFMYDAEKNYIRHEWAATSGLITLDSNCGYIKFRTGSSYGTTYKNDICINLHWSGTRDSEYEPYVKHSYPLDSSLVLRGIPKWGTDGMYYDGDRYNADGTVERRYGIVDLGTLTWGYNTNYTYFSAPITSMITQPDKSNYIPNIKCAKYITYQNDLNAVTANHPDKTISSRPVAQTIYVKDSAYTDADAFKTAMSGVYLVYELATPTTETAEPYTNPQIVEDFGTEEYVTTGKVAVGHNTLYPQNLRDKLQHLPDLADSDGAYMIQQTGTQMTLVLFRIPKAENLADGTYTLKATVSGGTPTYTWEADE